MPNTSSLMNIHPGQGVCLTLGLELGSISHRCFQGSDTGVQGPPHSSVQAVTRKGDSPCSLEQRWIPAGKVLSWCHCLWATTRHLVFWSQNLCPHKTQKIH